MAKKQITGTMRSVGLDTTIVSGLTKVMQERLLANTPLGNGNLMSGLIKMAIGVGCYSMSGNRYVKAVGTGFGIDGVEDIALSFMRGRGAGGGQMVI